ncbi:VOC family protein [Henriciella aquimarina]|uniref:VOC family protein n=1 Tax=Henriciella aquimarina TaxID=545261 RepID=UPI0009FFE3AC|nr:VOC family protein [Henriciella aquimarina]
MADTAATSANPILKEGHEDFDKEREYATRSPEDQRLDKIRRDANPAQGLSHTALRVKDARVTTKFYEEVVGLPLVRTDVVEKLTAMPPYDKPFDMMHFFFELGDGSLLAFFELEEGTGPELHEMPGDALQWHFAIQLRSEQEVRDVEKRAKEAGINCFYIPHDESLSLYLEDPDGFMLEVNHHRPHFDTLIDPKAAHERIEEWHKNGRRW